MESWRTLWDFEHPEAAERRFREALTRAGSPEERAVIETQIARALGLQRRFADAHAALDAIGEDAAVAPEVAIRRALERGRLFNSAGEADRATPWFREALAIAELAGPAGLAIDALHMLAIVAPPEEQLDLNLRALKLAEVSDDPSANGWVGSLLNNIGWTYHDRGNFAFALSHFQRAAAWRRTRGEQRDIEIADWSVARTLRSLGRVDEALAIQQRLAASLAVRGANDPYVEEELGECLLIQGSAEEATASFRAAYEGLRADHWLIEHEPDRLGRLRHLGGLSPESEPS